MEIYVSKDGAQTGPFPLNEVERMVAAGQFARTDYGWREGLADWIPLIDILPASPKSAPPPLPRRSNNLNDDAGGVFERVAHKITSVAGVDKIEGLSGKEFLSSVLKKRSHDDVEELFITGTSRTTPPLDQIDTSWPRPWLFFKALIASFIMFAGFYYGYIHFENPGLIPGVIFIGAFAIPFSTLIFFVEMNVPRNVSFYQVFRLVLFGGVISMLIALALETWFPGEVGTWFGGMTIGAAEESAKLLAVIILMRNTRYIWTLNGLLLGSAVGAGFAAFETAGYIADPDTGGMSTMAVRAFYTPFGHIVWTGLAAAALWRVKGQSPFKWEMLKDFRFLRIFIIVAVLHGLWDGPVQYFPFEDYQFDVVKVLLGVAAWIIVFGFVQDGLKQIRAAQQAQEGNKNTLPPTFKEPIMEIYVSKDGAQAGPFPVEEVERMVSTGRYSSDDVAWHEGLTEWIPLSLLLKKWTPAVSLKQSQQDPDKSSKLKIFGWMAGVSVCVLLLISLVMFLNSRNKALQTAQAVVTNDQQSNVTANVKDSDYQDQHYIEKQLAELKPKLQQENQQFSEYVNTLKAKDGDSYYLILSDDKQYQQYQEQVLEDQDEVKDLELALSIWNEYHRAPTYEEMHYGWSKDDIEKSYDTARKDGMVH